MSESPQPHLADELLANPEQLRTHLQTEALRLQQLVHALTAPEHGASVTDLQLVAGLGGAAYHMALAAEAIKEVEVAVVEPEVVQPPAPQPVQPKLPVAEPIVEVAPVPEAEQSAPEAVEASPSPVVESEVEPEPEPDPAYRELPTLVEPETGSDLQKLVGKDMTNVELKHIVQILSMLQDSQTTSLRDICTETLGKNRLSRTAEKRLVELLNGYDEAGVLVARGKTYRLPTEAEAATTAKKDVSRFFEIDESVLEDADINALELFKRLSFDGTQRVNIGQFVRTFFNEPRVPRDVYRNVIDHVNYYASLGYLEHIGGSWYAMGSRSIPERAEERVEQAARVAPSAPVTPPTTIEKQSKQVVELDALVAEATQKANLTPREAAMYRVVLTAPKLEKWFRRSDVDMGGSDITFSSDSALSQAWSKCTEKLVAAGILLSNGKQKGGRKYALPDTTKQALKELSKQAAAQPKSRNMPQKLVDPRLIVHRFDPEESYTARRQKQRDAAIEFAASVVLRVEETLWETDEGSIPATQAIEIVATEFELDKMVGHNVLDALSAKGYFHFEGMGASKKLVLGPVDELTLSQRRREKKSVKHLTEWDVKQADHIFTELLKLTHVQQGIEPRDLIKQFKISQKDQPRFRATLRKLTKLGYLYYDPKANPNTRSDHSKKLYLPMVKVANQKIKDHMKHNRTGLMRDLRKLVKN
jgi:hypothetical protein